MKRRDFLVRGLLSGLALSIPSWAQADAGSYASFRAGLRRHPQLVALRGTEQEMLSGLEPVEPAAGRRRRLTGRVSAAMIDRYLMVYARTIAPLVPTLAPDP